MIYINILFSIQLLSIYFLNPFLFFQSELKIRFPGILLHDHIIQMIYATLLLGVDPSNSDNFWAPNVFYLKTSITFERSIVD